MSLPPEVTGALQSLIASEELTEALRPHSRDPGSLYYSWARVSEVRLRLLTGFPLLRLPARAVAGRREVLAVPGQDGEPHFGMDEEGRPSTSTFALFYLPRDLDWRQANRCSVLEQEVTALYAQLPFGDRPWPESVVCRRHAFDGEGFPGASTAGDDFTVVEVGGTSVGVQVDCSGAVSVGWSVRRSSRGVSQVWNVTMWTRGAAVEIVQMVRDAGVLR